MTKRYLHTSEEVIDALKAGKVIRDKDSQWTLRDGFIIRKDANYASWVINDCISSNYAGIYVEESEPLKLEVGKFYRTRDGRKAFVFAESNCENRNYCFDFVIVNQSTQVISCTKEGCYFCDGDEDVHDLVAPWDE